MCVPEGWAALRLLVPAGALPSGPESVSRVQVRLPATPDRIKRELGEGDALPLELLRALWRVAGDTLNDGASVDLDRLPPVFGGVVRAMALLDQLQARQFVEWHRAGGTDRITDLRRPLSAYPLDWAALDRRRKAELSKLDSMQQYAYASGCRRGFVLRYFGDPAAGKDCGGCDNCLGTPGASGHQRTALGVPKPGWKKRSRGAGRAASPEEPRGGMPGPSDSA